ncbi:MAG: AAA family ATPase [Ktedonobacteraceae bacterium]
MLIAMAGLPGTGKSTLAHHLADALGAIVLDKDVIRAALFPPAWVEYTTEQDDFCMSIMFQIGAYMLHKDPHQPVILDGRTFSRHYQVMALKRFIEELQIPLRIIECVCSEETARQRLEEAASGKEKHLAENRDYALYLEIRARFEPINEPKLVVNTDEDFAHCLDMCLSYTSHSFRNSFGKALESNDKT